MNKQLFLIDDDTDDCDIFLMALERASIKADCKTAHNGRKALEVLNAETGFVPDLIFLDLNMPFISGKQCLEEIKKIPRLSQIPVVIYTTSSNSKDIRDTKELGASHYLTKPSSISALVQVLEKLLKEENLPYQIGLPD